MKTNKRFFKTNRQLCTEEVTVMKNPPFSVSNPKGFLFFASLSIILILAIFSNLSTKVTSASQNHDITIYCQKKVTTENAPEEEFNFTVIQTDADGKPLPGSTGYTETCSVKGSGRFTFSFKITVETNKESTFYFKIAEKNSGKPGWNYDETEYIVTVHVDATKTPAVITIKYPDSTPLVFGPIQGDSSTVDTQNSPFDFDEKATYRRIADSGSNSFRFIVSQVDNMGNPIEGTKKYEVACANVGLHAPGTNVYLPAPLSRADTLSALAFALSREASMTDTDAPPFSGFGTAEWAKLFALPTDDASLSAYRPLEWMQLFIWLQEVTTYYPDVHLDLLNPGSEDSNAWKSKTPGDGLVPLEYKGFDLGFRITNGGPGGSRPNFPKWDQYIHVATLLNEMFAQYTAQKTTALTFIYTPDLGNNTKGKLEFGHIGYVPHGTARLGTIGEEIYDTYLSWAKTNGVSVSINDGAAITDPGSGIKVMKSDKIIVTNTTGAPVDFALVDKQHYLKAGSIKGWIFDPDEGSEEVSPYQNLLIGHAEFVTLKSVLKTNPQGLLSFTNSYEENSPDPSPTPGPSSSNKPSPTPNPTPTPDGGSDLSTLTDGDAPLQPPGTGDSANMTIPLIIVVLNLGIILFIMLSKKGKKVPDTEDKTSDIQLK